MFDFCRSILLIATASGVAGCADNSDWMDLRVGLFFTEGTRSLIMRFEPYHYPVMDVKDDLRVGKDVVLALARASRRIFASVEVLDSCPTPELIVDRRLNLVIIAHALPGGGSLGYQGDGFQNSSEASRSLTAKLAFYSPEMIEIAAVTASGEGKATAKGILFDSRRRAFVGAVKAAIRNLGDDMALQMSSNPEIRKTVK